MGIREFTQKTLRNVLDNSLDGIMAFRAKRNKESRAIDGFELILSNAIASKSTGKSESELIGKQLQSIFPIESEDLFDTFKEVVQTGQPAQFEKLYQDDHFNGWYNITVVKLEDGFVVTFSNITTQKRQRLISGGTWTFIKGSRSAGKYGQLEMGWVYSDHGMV